MNQGKKVMLLALTAAWLGGAVAAEAPPAAPTQGMPSGDDIVRQCDFKYPGEDQQSRLTITLKDRTGNERKTIYLRLWKDMKGKDGIMDKMTLFTLFPPEDKGAAFMRWGYTEEGRSADQWIYLPSLRKIRRVSVRDLADAFLGSDLTYGDISYRALEADKHKLLRIDRDRQNREYYVIETTPKEKKPQYSKRISWFTKGTTPDACLKVRVDYYDPKGGFLKRQFLKWQQVDSAWIWDEVAVTNVQTFHQSHFKVTHVKINNELNDDWFTERRLRLGLK